MGPTQIPESRLTATDAQLIADAARFLSETGLIPTSELEYPVKVVDNLGAGIFGLAKKGTIYISRQTLERGAQFLTSTIYEEYCHLRYGFLDESRAFQDFILDKLIYMTAAAHRAGAFQAQE